MLPSLKSLSDVSHPSPFHMLCSISQRPRFPLNAELDSRLKSLTLVILNHVFTLNVPRRLPKLCSRLLGAVSLKHNRRQRKYIAEHACSAMACSRNCCNLHGAKNAGDVRHSIFEQMPCRSEGAPLRKIGWECPSTHAVQPQAKQVQLPSRATPGVKNARQTGRPPSEAWAPGVRCAALSRTEFPAALLMLKNIWSYSILGVDRYTYIHIYIYIYTYMLMYLFVRVCWCASARRGRGLACVRACVCVSVCVCANPVTKGVSRCCARCFESQI